MKFPSHTVLTGILGGFAPPTPDAIHTITKSSDNNALAVASYIRPSGQSSLQEALPKEISADDQHTESLIHELQGILKTIPTEDPPGSEDIYGLNTSITWGSEEVQWQNSAPGGCVRGVSEVQPTKEQKAKFKRAVEIVNELVKKDARG